PTAPASTSTSNAGITATQDGRRIIPASTRADGSVRRELRVRPGYRPPEDVELYRNRNTTAAARAPSGPVGGPGAIPVDNDDEGDKGGGGPLTKNAKKRAAARKRKEEGGGGDATTPATSTTSTPTKKDEEPTTTT